MNRLEILDAARKAVSGRPSDYGKPEDSFDKIAKLWNVHLFNAYDAPASILPHDVAIMLALLKIARLESAPNHPDSWADLAGYASCGGEVATEAAE